jgi:hypothetical protein
MMKMEMLRRKFMFLTLAALVSLSSAAYAKPEIDLTGVARALHQPSQDSQRRVQSELFIRTELFFGTGKPDGGVVTKEEFFRFLDQEITPRFPDGLTLLSGRGQFRDSSGKIIKEKAKVLILLYPLNSWASSSEKIEQIRDLYKTAFQQQSVLRVDNKLPVLVSF